MMLRTFVVWVKTDVIALTDPVIGLLVKTGTVAITIAMACLVGIRMMITISKWYFLSHFVVRHGCPFAKL